MKLSTGTNYLVVVVLVLLLILLVLSLNQMCLALTNFDQSQELVTQSNGTQRSTTSNNQMNLNFIRKLKYPEEIMTEKQFEHVNHILYEGIEAYHKFSMSQIGYMALTTKAIATPYNEYQTQRYDSYEQLKKSGGPLVDQELCLKQLNYLNDKLQEQQINNWSNKYSPLYGLLDSFGRTPAGLFEGNLMWLGLYDKCLRIKLDFSQEIANSIEDERQRETRYCFASFKLNDWPKEQPWSNYIAFKLGVCLPKACDSMNYKNKFELVNRLIEFNARDIEKGTNQVSDLYCLPDEESSLRSWWLIKETLASVCLLSLWFCLILYSTYRSIIFERRRGRETIEKSRVEEKSFSFSMTKGFSIDQNNNNNSKEEEDQEKENNLIVESSAKISNYEKIYKSLSLTQNLKHLFDINKKSSMMIEMENKRNFGTNTKESTTNHSSADTNESKDVNLEVLNGIKVILMIYVMMGHVLLGLSKVMENCKAVAIEFKLAFYVANMAPAFAVNGFFTITGILTAYLIFKANKSQKFISSPMKWFAFIAYRYMRIIPMYLLVVLYAKHLAKFAGSGPLWDYGTSSLGFRKKCQDESWLYTLLFMSNFKSPIEHCVVSGWYLANDFQFFLVTPIFMFLLYKNVKLGRANLWFAAIGAYALTVYHVYMSDWHDFRPIASFQAHGAIIYLNSLSWVYTQPQYRIPAYLCGLLMGHSLFQFEEAREKHLIIERINDNKQETLNKVSNEVKNLKKIHNLQPNWSSFLLRRGNIISFGFLAFCIIVPILATFISFDKSSAKLSVAVIQPILHIAFSIGSGLNILLAATNNGNKTLTNFLSHPNWKPMARLSLCTVLIQMEVIDYIMSTFKQTQDITYFFYLSLNAYCIAASYAVSILLCVFFEAPIRGLLNNLVSQAVGLIVSKKIKQKEQLSGEKHEISANKKLD